MELSSVRIWKDVGGPVIEQSNNRTPDDRTLYTVMQCELTSLFECVLCVHNMRYIRYIRYKFPFSFLVDAPQQHYIVCVCVPCWTDGTCHTLSDVVCVGSEDTTTRIIIDTKHIHSKEMSVCMLIYCIMRCRQCSRVRVRHAINIIIKHQTYARCYHACSAQHTHTIHCRCRCCGAMRPAALLWQNIGSGFSGSEFHVRDCLLYPLVWLVELCDWNHHPFHVVHASVCLCCVFCEICMGCCRVDWVYHYAKFTFEQNIYGVIVNVVMELRNGFRVSNDDSDSNLQKIWETLSGRNEMSSRCSGMGQTWSVE